MKRVLALDVGDVRIGIAISDIMAIIANPFETYKRCGIEQTDVKYICELCKQKEVGLIVCGLPLLMSGQDSMQTQKVRKFAELLQEQSGLTVKLADERLTTAAAERVLIEGNVRRENRKKYIDKVAATIILQAYLDYSK